MALGRSELPRSRPDRGFAGGSTSVAAGQSVLAGGRGRGRRARNHGGGLEARRIVRSAAGACVGRPVRRAPRGQRSHRCGLRRHGRRHGPARRPRRRRSSPCRRSPSTRWRPARRSRSCSAMSSRCTVYPVAGALALKALGDPGAGHVRLVLRRRDHRRRLPRDEPAQLRARRRRALPARRREPAPPRPAGSIVPVLPWELVGALLAAGAVRAYQEIGLIAVAAPRRRAGRAADAVAVRRAHAARARRAARPGRRARGAAPGRDRA